MSEEHAKSIERQQRAPRARDVLAHLAISEIDRRVGLARCAHVAVVRRVVHAKATIAMRHQQHETADVKLAPAHEQWPLDVLLHHPLSPRARRLAAPRLSRRGRRQRAQPLCRRSTLRKNWRACAILPSLVPLAMHKLQNRAEVVHHLNALASIGGGGGLDNPHVGPQLLRRRLCRCDRNEVATQLRELADLIENNDCKRGNHDV